MSTLRIPLSQVTGDGIAIDAIVSADDLRPEDAKELPLGPVTVSGSLSEASGEYLFQGRIRGTYQHPCDRCLDAAEQPFDQDAVWVFVESPAQALSEKGEADGLEADDIEDAADVIAFKGDAIDLGAQAWEEIVLALPTKFLCKEECAGLCPTCGANLNRESCSCEQVETMANTGLAGLADLLPDLRPKRSEDEDRAGTKT